MQGAPNIGDFLPAPESIIDYRALGSPAALRRELLRLGSDAAAWNVKVRAALTLSVPALLLHTPWAGRSGVEVALCQRERWARQLLTTK